MDAFSIRSDSSRLEMKWYVSPDKEAGIEPSERGVSLRDNGMGDCDVASLNSHLQRDRGT